MAAFLQSIVIEDLDSDHDAPFRRAEVRVQPASAAELDPPPGPLAGRSLQAPRQQALETGRGGPEEGAERRLPVELGPDDDDGASVAAHREPRPRGDAEE